MDYIIGLARFTRQHRRVYLGVSPRASLMLLHAAKARALIRDAASCSPTTSRAWRCPCWRTACCSPGGGAGGDPPEEVVIEGLEKVRYQNRR